MGKKYYKALVVHNRWKNWHNLVDNPEILKKTYNVLYWDAIKILYPDKPTPTPTPNSNIKLWLILLIILIIFLIISGIIILIIFYRRRKKANAEEVEELTHTEEGNKAIQ